MPLATCSIVQFDRTNLILKALSKIQQMDMTEKLLIDCANMLKVSNISKDIGHAIKVAARGYYYVSLRIGNPSLKRKWNGMACENLDQYYDQCSRERQTEIRLIRGQQKLLNIGQILDSYGLYSQQTKKIIQEHQESKEELSSEFIAQLFEVIFIEFFVQPFDKQIMNAMKECIQMAEVANDDVHCKLISIWLDNMPINIKAIQLVMEISNKSKCADVLIASLYKVG